MAKIRRNALSLARYVCDVNLKPIDPHPRVLPAAATNICFGKWPGPNPLGPCEGWKVYRMQPMLKVIATLCAALFTGGALYISLVEHPVRMADMAIALREFRHSYRRAAPWQASTAVICFLTAVLLSALTTGWWWAIGGSTVGAVVPFTLLVMLPTNKHLLDEKARLNPDEATSLLEHWGQLHWVQTILGTLGLMVLLAKGVL